jgi:hypothetical protein
MKKILALLSVVALVSCGGQQKTPDVPKDSTVVGVVDSTMKQDTVSVLDTTSGVKVVENQK